MQVWNLENDVGIIIQIFIASRKVIGQIIKRDFVKKKQ